MPAALAASGMRNSHREEEGNLLLIVEAANILEGKRARSDESGKNESDVVDTYEVAMNWLISLYTGSGQLNSYFNEVHLLQNSSVPWKCLD